LEHSGQKQLKKWVYIGLALGLFVTAVVLAAVVSLFVIYAEGFGFGINKMVQGVLGVAAAILIGFVCLTLGDLLEKREKIENYVFQAMEKAEKVEEDLSEEEKEKQMYENMKNLPQDETWKTIFFVSFTSVVREGFETIVFLGVGSGFQPTALPIPILVGAALGAFCGYLMYKSSGKVAIQRFVNGSIVLLLFVGAGIFAHGIFEFQELHIFWGRPWDLGEPMWDISDCCGYDKQLFTILRGLFGYTPFPSVAEAMSYFGFWIAMFICFEIKWYIRRNNIDIKAQLKSICCRDSTQVETENQVSAQSDGPELSI
jgi:high-affinity iron transporter